mmetsp:Transcript_14698/g.14886  ORF Transcript_14698/g.14886 Transcript_14698/m.14886 type:complete len:407 (-) Transcript_14698:149-1369(-)
MSAAFRVEVVVIGAGVLGLACARSISMLGKEVLILERANTIASGTSSRNSEIIHAGLYYKPNELKTQFCVRGKNLLYDYCKTRNITHKKIGKLIVASNERQVSEDLDRILRNAENNGVDDLKILSKHDVTYLEPDVESYGGILSPSTGIFDSHEYMLSLLADAEENGSTMVLNCPVESVRMSNSEGEFSIIAEDGTEVLCDSVVNCAGLFAHDIASCIINSARSFNNSETRNENQSFVSNYSDLSATANRTQYFAKGNYFQLVGQAAPFHHLIYPVPEPGGLGIHATLDCAGQCRFGPDVEWISKDVSCPDSIDMNVDPKRADVFYNAIRKYWPGLKDGALIPDYAGLRPKLGHPNLNDGPSIKADFILEGPQQHGIKGFVNMIGMESPGLTSSLAIADRVASNMR